jgi:thiol:disulfide interchange protein
MERTDDISTATMPRNLVILTAVMLLVRIILVPFELSAAKAPTASIPWIEVAKYAPAQNPDKKLLLLEFGADWCEPCKRMERSILSNKEIASMISTRFIPIQVRDRLKEDGKNTQQIADLEKKFHVFAFPTIVVTTADGEAVATLVGSASALSTVHFLSRAARPR